jgi:hypothetical protein
MKIVRGTDLQRKLLLLLAYWGTRVENWLAWDGGVLRTSKSAGSVKVGRAISTQWRQAMTLSCPLPSTEVAGTFAAVATRLSDV